MLRNLQAPAAILFSLASPKDVIGKDDQRECCYKGNILMTTFIITVSVTVKRGSDAILIFGAWTAKQSTGMSAALVQRYLTCSFPEDRNVKSL